MNPPIPTKHCMNLSFSMSPSAPPVIAEPPTPRIVPDGSSVNTERADALMDETKVQNPSLCTASAFGGSFLPSHSLASQAAQCFCPCQEISMGRIGRVHWPSHDVVCISPAPAFLRPLSLLADPPVFLRSPSLRAKSSDMGLKSDSSLCTGSTFHSPLPVATQKLCPPLEVVLPAKDNPFKVERKVRMPLAL